MHKHEMVHGGIKPSNIYIDKRNVALLGEI